VSSFGINKFACANFAGSRLEPRERFLDFSCFGFSKFALANRALARSTRSGVTCHG
jgi:hypothetical protein